MSGISFKQRILLRGLSLLICVAMLFSLSLANVVLAEDIELTAPVINAQGQYEISTPGQFMYMSKNFGKKDIPRNGKYILTADIDMAGINGFVAMGKDKDNGFRGVFDGQ